MESRYAQQFKKGSLDMILLSLISKGETYGYEIISSLNENGGKVFGHTKEGTVYPVLYRLESANLIQSRTALAAANGGLKKFYSITEVGERTLNEMITFWQEYIKCVNSFIGPDDKGGALDDKR